MVIKKKKKQQPFRLGASVMLKFAGRQQVVFKAVMAICVLPVLPLFILEKKKKKKEEEEMLPLLVYLLTRTREECTANGNAPSYIKRM